MKEWVIATRISKLALWQAKKVQSLLIERFPDYSFRLRAVDTAGDKDRSGKLWKMGGKGLFTKELEDAILSGDADMAVHSLKDLPTQLPKGLILAAVPMRDDPRDVLISKEMVLFGNLPAGAKMGTSSLRRQSQIRAIRNDLDLQDVRGNIMTRMKKALEGPLDAVILAKAGVMRLGLEEWVTQEFGFDEIMPAVGQGALAVEAGEQSEELLQMLDSINDMDLMTAARTERFFLARLGGGCRMPIAAFAHSDGKEIKIQGLVASIDGKKVIRSEAAGAACDDKKIGIALAEKLISQGADQLLEGSHEG